MQIYLVKKICLLTILVFTSILVVISFSVEQALASQTLVSNDFLGAQPTYVKLAQDKTTTDPKAKPDDKKTGDKKTGDKTKPSTTKRTDDAKDATISWSTSLDQTVGYFKNPLKAQSIPQLITILVKILLSLIGVGAIIMIIFAGFQMITSDGNESKLTKAKSTLTWAIVGLLVALLSFSIVAIVQQLIVSGT